jgi:hypothetical protein
MANYQIATYGDPTSKKEKKHVGTGRDVNTNSVQIIFLRKLEETC